MPTQKKLLPVAAILVVAFLAGCKTSSTLQHPADGQSQETSEVTVDETVASNAAAFQSALKLNDDSMCNELSDDKQKTACKNAVKDQVTLAAALSKNDPSLCKRMSSADQQKACNINVITQIKLQQQAKQRQKTNDDLYASLNKIIESGEYSQCKTLEVATIIASCETNIYTHIALEKNDITWCNKIASADQKNTCTQTVKSAQPH